MGWGIVNYPCMPCAEKLRQSGDEDMARLPEECALITGIAACNRDDSANMEAAYGGCCGLWPGRMVLACAPALSAANGSLLHQGTALQPQMSSRHKRLANTHDQRSLARSGAAIVGCRDARVTWIYRATWRACSIRLVREEWRIESTWPASAAQSARLARIVRAARVRQSHLRARDRKPRLLSGQGYGCWRGRCTRDVRV